MLLRARLLRVGLPKTRLLSTAASTPPASGVKVIKGPASVTTIPARDARDRVLKLIQAHLAEFGLAKTANTTDDKMDWKAVKFQDPSLKFKILMEAMELTERPISNVELNNIQSVQDLLDIISSPAIILVKERKTPLKKELLAMELPPNMQWIPSDKELRQARKRTIHIVKATKGHQLNTL